ncbi:MAG: caspase family protein [Myxococcales bacterium]|nr:caspase family protein [Myxococcales bacterium]
MKRIRTAALCVLLTSGLFDSAFAEVRRFALVIGNNTGAADQIPLRHAETDARALRDVLVDIGGFRKDDVTLLLGADVNIVRDAISQLRTAMANAKSHGTSQIDFVFYFSGHGRQNRIELGTTYLEIDEIKSLLRDSAATMRLGVVDACHSGGILRTKGGKRIDAFPLSVEDMLNSAGYAILTSSSATETSQESDELRSSFFTHSVISGLRGAADFSGDQRVSLSELYQYAYHATVRRTRHSQGGLQHPHFESVHSGDFIVTNLGRAQSLLTFPKYASGEYLVFDPKTDTMIAELAKIPGESRSLAVRPGVLYVYDRQGDRLKVAHIDVAPNTEVIVEPTAMEATTVAAYSNRGEELAVGVAARIGIQLFHNSSFRDSYVDNTVTFGVEVRLLNLGLPGLDLKLDAMFGTGEQQVSVGNIHELNQALFATNIGSSIQYRYQYGDFFTSLGPRVAWLFFRRHVDSTLIPENDRVQVYSTVSPGFEAEIGVLLMPRLSLGLNAQIAYLHFEADGNSTDLVTSSYTLGLQGIF